MTSRKKALLVVLFLLTGVLLYLAASGQGHDEVPPPRARLVWDVIRSKGGLSMPTVKVMELVGSSPRDWHDAVGNAIEEAGSMVPKIVGVEVCNWTASVSGGSITEYKANVKVAYSGDS